MPQLDAVGTVCMYVCSQRLDQQISRKLTASIIITRSARMICTRATLIHDSDVVAVLTATQLARPLHADCAWLP